MSVCVCVRVTPPNSFESCLNCELQQLTPTTKRLNNEFKSFGAPSTVCACVCVCVCVYIRGGVGGINYYGGPDGHGQAQGQQEDPPPHTQNPKLSTLIPPERPPRKP